MNRPKSRKTREPWGPQPTGKKRKLGGGNPNRGTGPRTMCLVRYGRYQKKKKEVREEKYK